DRPRARGRSRTASRRRSRRAAAAGAGRRAVAPLDRQAGLTRDAGAAESAVAVRVLREVLLVVVLREVELRRGQDLGGDGAVARLRERALVLVARALRGGALLLAEIVDAGSILRPDVVPLPHALRRVVALPERLEQIVVGDLLRVEDHQHGFVVPG